MGRPPATAHREGTADRILASALAVFARVGFAQARLADIAAGAGIRRPSLLYHFDTKERLYAAVVDRSFARLGQVLGEVMARPGLFADQLEALARTFTADLAAHPDDARVIVRELVAGEGPGQVILLQQVVPLLGRVVAFLEAEGASHLRPGLPVRAAVLQVVAHVLLQASAQPPLQEALWGTPDPDGVWALARGLFLAHPATAES